MISNDRRAPDRLWNWIETGKRMTTKAWPGFFSTFRENTMQSLPSQQYLAGARMNMYQKKARIATKKPRKGGKSRACVSCASREGSGEIRMRSRLLPLCFQVVILARVQLGRLRRLSRRGGRAVREAA